MLPRKVGGIGENMYSPICLVLTSFLCAITECGNGSVCPMSSRNEMHSLLEVQMPRHPMRISSTTIFQPETMKQQTTTCLH